MVLLPNVLVEDDPLLDEAHPGARLRHLVIDALLLGETELLLQVVDFAELVALVLLLLLGLVSVVDMLVRRDLRVVQPHRLL